MPTNIFLELTRCFNEGRQRAVMCGGQAVVLHRIALMSKDGDWILREDDEALRHTIRVLASFGAAYRFAAPLDVRWMRGGWSSHFEFRTDVLRVRTDFFTRPPRLEASDVVDLWNVQEHRDDASFLDLKRLSITKMTSREKDYVVIAEMARRMPDPSDQLLFSRSARDLMTLAASSPELVRDLTGRRPVLARIAAGREVLEQGLDAERRALIRADEQRLQAYREAAGEWAKGWPSVERRIQGLGLEQAHDIVARAAEDLLPCCPRGMESDA